MAKKVTKLKNDAIQYPVPQSRESCTEYIAKIGMLQRERKRIETAMNDAIAALKQQYEEQARPKADEIRALSAGVQVWCEANRMAITSNGKVKFANLAAGEIKWRMRPPRVTLRGKENIIETMKRLGLDRFLRVSVDVNKDALLAEPDVAATIPGVTIKQAEDFVIIPFETELEEVA